MHGIILMCLVAPVGCESANVHVERIRGESAGFEIVVPGTVDHRSMGGWKEDPRADHNPTLQLTIANVGDRPVVNPRVVVEGGPDWFDIDHIIREFARPGMSEQEKSFALWHWCRRHISEGPTFEGPIWGKTRSMTRFMNAFGTGACGTYHIVMPVIGRQAGLRTFSGCFADCSHAVQKEFYDGQDRYFDAHIPHGNGQPQGWFALKLDNVEIAGVDDIMADRYLIDRAGSGPERFDYVMYFGPGCSFHEVKPGHGDPHDLSMTLRPGERICWYWDMRAPAWQPDAADIVKTGVHTSGRVEFSPRLTDAALRTDAVAAVNMRSRTDGGGIAPADASRPAEIVYAVHCPYPITRASIDADVDIAEGGEASLAFSFDGKAFDVIWTSKTAGGRVAHAVAPAHERLRQPNFTHDLWFRAVLRGETTVLKRLTLREDFQAYRPSLPSLHTGRNRVCYAAAPCAIPDVDLTGAEKLGLRNGGFEDGAAAGQPPAGWTLFGRTDGSHTGEWFSGLRPVQGKTLLAAAAHHEVKNGGAYQRLVWRGGTRVNASVFVATPGDSTRSSGCRIGLDPTGGTDPAAASIVWSDWARSPTWKRIETGPVAVRSADRHITIFLAHRHALDGGRFNVTGFDACVLEDPDEKPRAAATRAARDMVLVEYRWRAMPDLPVPKAPASPVYPANGGRFGFNGEMKWSPASVAGKGTVDNYEIFISPRADLAWPVLPNTHRLTGSAQPSFRLIAPDALRDGVTYYWRVRGRSSDGVWGTWSEVWSFTASGPNAPRGLTARYDPGTGSAQLAWNAPAGGRAVDHYEVYGSGEHGFSPLREPEPGDAVGQRVVRPATLIAATKDTSFDVTGRPEAFYRVAAVDKEGNRSVVTPVAALPTPALLPVPLPPATAGKPYKTHVVARLRTGRYARSLRKGLIVDGADDPAFAITDDGGASWLSIDAKTGELRGTPQARGAWQITIRLADGRGGSATRTYTLRVP